RQRRPAPDQRTTQRNATHGRGRRLGHPRALPRRDRGSCRRRRRITRARPRRRGLGEAGRGDPMRVVIADDELLLREGLARLLIEAGFDVVGKAGTGEELMRLVDLGRPDVVLVDIKMPPTHTDEGLVAAQEIRRAYPEIGVLVLSHYLESSYAMRLLEQHPERVGYLLKERVSDVAVLADALRWIAEGVFVVDSKLYS